ncbi:MAG: HEAT repeat domain-containing protein [Tolypothrix carrinoi HA7290-LM1]|jgi:hypothetical protein|nr:HEAT repeat domain-containing protein [Tolypothrix carrinoi HA7290-LM1]
MHDWQYFFNHVDNSLNEGAYRIFEPEWKAEILHWFNREDVGKKQKEEFIQALIDFDDGCGDFYRYRAYFLACEALAYFPDCSLGDRIVEQLLKLSYAYFRQDKRDWQILPQPLVKTAIERLELTEKKRVVAAFVQLVHTTESRTIMQLAAEKLGEIDPGNKSAIAALFFLKPPAEDIPTFSQINPIPEKIVSVDENAIAAVIHTIETTLSKEICYDAIASLGKIAYGNQAAITALEKFLQINQGDRICLEAATTLWKIDLGNVAALNALVYILETTGNAHLLDCAAAYLLEIDPGKKAAIVALLKVIENSSDQSLCRVAAFHLGEFDPSNKVAISTLSQILETSQRQTSKDEWQQFYAAKSLIKIDPDNAKAIATLSQMLETSERQWMRLQAAEYLVQIEDYRQQAIKALWEVIDLQDEYETRNAIAIFAKIDPSYQLAINAEIQLLKTTHNISILIDAVQNVEEFNLGNKLVKDKLNEVISILIRLIQVFQESDENKDDFYPKAISKLSYESCLLDIADSLTKILESEHLPQVVIALKEYLSEKFYKNSSYRYEAVFDIIWHCAENMTYPEFYKAWHS